MVVQSGRIIGVGLLILSTAFAATAEQSHEDDDGRFDRRTASAAQVASEAEKRYQLYQLSLLEDAPPAQTKQETLQFLQRVQSTCKRLKQVDPAPPGYCPYFYDSFSCWRPAPIGNTSVKLCPNYILGMHMPGVKIEIYCKTGHPAEGSTDGPFPMWDYISTNESHFLQLYGSCFENIPPPTMRSVPALHLMLQGILQKTQMVGPICYSISLVALVLASLIFIVFPRLHCPRNFIHLHLFLAFMIRAIMCLLQYYLFENGRGMSIDGEVTEENGVLKFLKGGLHWECKLVIAIWNYSLVASYFWLLVEGLYLHNVVYFFVFRETGIAGYAIFGWVAPMLVLVPWIAVKVLVEDHLCWVSYLNLNYFWILRGPIMATIIINFLLFINMIRELFLKLKDSNITETRRYRKLAKSSVLLVVILGVYYFIISIPMLLLDTDQLTWPLLVCLSIEHIFGSLQGLMVALVYCFMNSEVRGVIRKKWYRWILLRQVGCGAYSSNPATAGTGVPQSRQGSAAALSLMAAFFPQSANVNNSDADLSTRIRRTLFQRKSNPQLLKNGDGKAVRRVLSCSPASTAPSPTPTRQKCPVAGEFCVSCRIADSTCHDRLQLCDRLGSPPSSPDNRGILKRHAETCDTERTLLNDPGTPRSHNLCDQRKGPYDARNHSLRMRPLKRCDAGDTISLLRMRSPHSLDMQELSRGTRRRSRDELEIATIPPPPPTRFLKAGREADRRFSLNCNAAPYLPLSPTAQKTTPGSNRSPLVTGCWQKQSADAFL